MKKSNVLTKAAQQILSTQQITNSRIEETEQPKYLKSALSNHVLQQMDDDYKQIEAYQTKYVDQQGNQIDENYQNKIQPKYNNQKIIKKDLNSKNRFLQSPIIQEPHGMDQEEENKNVDSPIKQLSKKNNLRSNQNTFKYQNESISQSRQKPGTLLQNYKKSASPFSNKYQAQLQNYSRLKNSKKKQTIKSSIITNAHKLNQEDFYKLDYMNTGKFNNSNFNTGFGSNNGSKGKFFDGGDDLNQIEDIISDIKNINTNGISSKYFNSRLAPDKSSIITSTISQKYKGIKNTSEFKKKNSSFNQVNQFGSKLDDLLNKYQFSDTFSYLSEKNQSRVYEQERSQKDDDNVSQTQSNMSSARLSDKTRLQLKRQERQEKRKNNKYYQQIKNQIKYGTSEQNQFQNRNNQQKHKQIQNNRNDFSRNELSNSKLMKQSNVENQDNKYEQQQYERQLEAEEIINSKIEEKQDQEQESQQKQLKSSEIKLQDKTKKASNLTKSNQNIIKDNKMDNNQKSNKKQLQLDKQLINLINEIKIVKINWQQLPLILTSYESFFNTIQIFPTFSSEQNSSIIQTFQKLHSNSFHTYSLFSYSASQNTEQIFGCQQIKTKSKTTTKSYKLISKQQFISKWNEIYQKQKKSNQKIKNKNKLALSQDQIQILIQFDLKWYKTIVKSIYQQEIDQIISIYKNNKPQQYQKHVDSKRFISKIKEIKEFHKKDTRKLSIKQLVVQNKLRYLKNYFETYANNNNKNKNTQLIQKNLCLIGLIPQILSSKTSQKQQSIIKSYLKQNFRGGIYFIDQIKKKNICILQLNKNTKYSIQQSTQKNMKQLLINKRVSIILAHSQQKDPKIERPQNILNVEVHLINQEGQNDQKQMRLKSHYNQIQFQVQEKQDQNLQGYSGSFFKEYANIFQTNK